MMEKLAAGEGTSLESPGADESLQLRKEPAIGLLCFQPPKTATHLLGDPEMVRRDR
jgi:hypothetical protein